MSGAYPELTGRMLVINASPDVGAQYVATMNCIFSAQKVGVAIDGCAMSSNHSNFLQQAAHVTGGVYLQPTPIQHAALCQCLVTYFLPRKESELYLRQLPKVCVVHTPCIVLGVLDVGCWMLDVGCWMLDVGCWVLGVGC